MHILSLGLSHSSAPLAVRERLALSPAAIARLMARLAEAGVAESAVLSACGRIEVYAAGAAPADVELLVQALAREADESRDQFEPYLYQHRDGEAVARLLRAAAGLDSLVLGDPSLSAAIARAWDRAVEAGTAGAALGTLFQAALSAARRVRAETALSAGVAGLPHVAAAIVARAVDDLPGPRVLVLGAGDAAAQVVSGLRAHTAADVVVLNRTRAHAERLAREFDTDTEALHRLPDLMSGSHALIAAVGVPQPLVSEAMVLRGALAPRRRPFIIADLGLPRCVSYDAARVPAVQYMDIDAFATLAAAMAADRASAIPDAEAIVKAEVERAMAALAGQPAARVITAPKGGAKGSKAPTG